MSFLQVKLVKLFISDIEYAETSEIRLALHENPYEFGETERDQTFERSPDEKQRPASRGDEYVEACKKQLTLQENPYEFAEAQHQTFKRSPDEEQRPASRVIKADTKSTTIHTKKGEKLKTGLLIISLMLTIASTAATIGLFIKMMNNEKAQEKHFSMLNSLSTNFNQTTQKITIIEEFSRKSIGHFADSNKKLENLMMTMQTNYNNSRLERRDLKEKYDSQLETIQTNYNNSLVELREQSHAMKMVKITRDALWGLGGYTASNGFDYKVTQTSQNFQESREACARMGGHLAYVGVRNETIYSKIFENVGKELSQIYFDLSDIAKEGEFRWGDGVLASSTWTNWKDGEPNDSGGIEDCALSFESNTNWNDDQCSKEYNALCERRSF